MNSLQTGRKTSALQVIISCFTKHRHCFLQLTDSKDTVPNTCVHGTVNGIEITAMSKSKTMDTLDCPLMSAITKSFAPPIAAQDIGEQETLSCQYAGNCLRREGYPECTCMVITHDRQLWDVQGSSMYLAGQMYNVTLEEKLALRCHKANL
jgi:hypothetical protein